ncbi:hypothetical protein HPB49_001757 [Dermacentor silvarum]|uniref:Uncharacterized protein n=1 Tax=Dermacentor silvarum TaxID=543639 RepID=A0ACB8CUI0_DERSI|nr:hypothetical protein HPB49_001757 [Dermacentor silvarum]
MSSEAQLPGGSCRDRASPRLLSLPRQAAPRCSSPFVTCRSSTWQFNFKFSLSEDTYVQDSIDLLMHSGIQFGKHNNEGIDPFELAQLIMTSGMVLSDEITWLAFHSCYDFAYMLKQLTGDNLPASQVDFFEILEIYCSAIHDLKCLMKDCRNLRGVQGLAEQLQVE